MASNHWRYWNICIRNVNADSGCSPPWQRRTVIAIHGAAGSSKAPQHCSFTPPGPHQRQAASWDTTGAPTRLSSRWWHTHRPGVTTAQTVSVAQQMAMLSREKRIRNALFSLSFRISAPPEISCFRIFGALQKNTKDAAISWGMRRNVRLIVLGAAFKKKKSTFLVEPTGCSDTVRHRKPRTWSLQG